MKKNPRRKVTVYQDWKQAAKVAEKALRVLRGTGYDTESEPFKTETVKEAAWRKEIAAARLLLAIRTLGSRPVDVRVETDWETGIVMRIEVHDGDSCLALEI